MGTFSLQLVQSKCAGLSSFVVYVDCFAIQTDRQCGWSLVKESSMVFPKSEASLTPCIAM